MYNLLTSYAWWPANVWCDMSWAAAKWAGSPFADQFDFTPQEVAAVAHDNAASLYGFDPA